MTYDFKKELTRQKGDSPVDILNIAGENSVTLRKTTNRDSVTQKEYTMMGIIMDDLKNIYKKIPESDIANVDFARGYSVAEHVWNDALHVILKAKYDVAREDIDIIFAVKDNYPTLEIKVEKDGKSLYELGGYSEAM